MVILGCYKTLIWFDKTVDHFITPWDFETQKTAAIFDENVAKIIVNKLGEINLRSFFCLSNTTYFAEVSDHS